MVFWKTYPIENIYKTIINKYPFHSLIFNKNNINNISIDLTLNIINKDNYNIYLLKEISLFLRTYFGSPPNTPILDIPINTLLNSNDHILFIKNTKEQIIACIRYHYLGIFITSNNEPIYCIDCFCIHPEWRKKDLGDYLLTTLHNYVNQNNIPYSMFLKEGKQLGIIHRPLYKGIYTYKELKNTKSLNIKSLNTYQAYKIIDIFLEFNKNIFVIQNKDNTNQIWKLYKKNSKYILACFQDTYQTFREKGQNKKIGWITAWFESSNMSDNCREEASIELADAMFSSFDYIWANKQWTGTSNLWKEDGPFYWYLYQWTTSIHLGKSYCIMN